MNDLREYGIFLGFQVFIIKTTLAHACGRPLQPLIIDKSLASLIETNSHIQIDNPQHRYYSQWERLLKYADEMDMCVDWVRTIDEAGQVVHMVAIQYASRKELFFRFLRKLFRSKNSTAGLTLA